MKLSRIISGAQTGVDRAALDVALEVGIPCGGWVPQGRLDECGVIPPQYSNLQETDSPQPELRTELNVRDADATLILSHGPLRGGSQYTAEKAVELGRPHLHVDMATISHAEAVAQILAWLAEIKPTVLNIAGPRHSVDPTIYAHAKTILKAVLLQLNSAITA